MVHEINVQSGVPEELYNLTQLAEVSLAAGKLPYMVPKNKYTTTSHFMSTN